MSTIAYSLRDMDESKNKYEAHWDQDNLIYHLVSKGDFDKEKAVDQTKFVAQEIHTLGVKPVKFLVDLSQVGKATLDAQICFAEFMKSDVFSKQAFVGLSKEAQKSLPIIRDASGAENVAFFHSVEEAREWLKK
jgi:hypothetical protein